MSHRYVSLVALLAIALSTTKAEAQRPQSREGFWFNIGLGVGSLGCNDCEARESGLSGGLALGGTVSKHWLIGLFSNAWTRSENGAAVAYSGGDANFGQIGIGITIH